jgi:poly(3-hydroxybutyrate) depolymerase
MADTGYLHVPEDCLNARACRVHVVFHGCNQTGEDFVRDAGYLGWADGNRIILLFPQVEKQPLHDPPGCWDWVGYTGPDYLTREGAQISAVRRMLERLAEQTN